jgi:hypothetical protein
MRHELRATCYALLGLLTTSFTLHDAAFSPAPKQAPAGGENQIKLLALNQPPCTTLSKDAVITAKVAYRIAQQEQSEHGYEVSIKFQGTDPRMTFSVGHMSGVAATTKSDTLTLQYPMSSIWNNPRLKRPLTCYFYLHRNTGQGRSTVIAKTEPVVFSECQ